MTNEDFTPILLDELRKTLRDESNYQNQRSSPDREVLKLLYNLNIRLDQLHLNLINRGVVVGKFQSLHLKDPYK